MASDRQIEANRRNGKRNPGPKTEQARAAIRNNALKHGLTSTQSVLPYEDKAGFEEFRDSLLAAHEPPNSHEKMLVEEVARCCWRLLRLRRVETEMYDLQIRTLKRKLKVDDNPGGRHEHINNDGGIAVVLTTEPEGLYKNYFRYEASIERAYYRALQQLERAQSIRRRVEKEQRTTLASNEAASKEAASAASTKVADSGIRSVSQPPAVVEAPAPKSGSNRASRTAKPRRSRNHQSKQLPSASRKLRR
ncbi:MAG: hypothetical protein ACRD7E_05825 [Bryobacteraceae bacterium]